MKKFLIMFVMLAVVCVFSTANAKDMRGKFGLGGKATLGGVVGLEGLYWLGDFGIDFGLDLDVFKPDGKDADINVGVFVGGIYNFAKSQNANFGIALRVNVGIAKKGAADVTFGINIEIPLRAEYFFSDHFSIHLKVGFTFEILTKDGQVLQTPTGQQGLSGVSKKSGFGLAHGTGLLGGGGFTFYF